MYTLLLRCKIGILMNNQRGGTIITGGLVLTSLLSLSIRILYSIIHAKEKVGIIIFPVTVWQIILMLE